MKPSCCAWPSRVSHNSVRRPLNRNASEAYLWLTGDALPVMLPSGKRTEEHLRDLTHQRWGLCNRQLRGVNGWAEGSRTERSDNALPLKWASLRQPSCVG